jgi:hypothetical protein
MFALIFGHPIAPPPNRVEAPSKPRLAGSMGSQAVVRQHGSRRVKLGSGKDIAAEGQQKEHWALSPNCPPTSKAAEPTAFVDLISPTPTSHPKKSG